MFYLLGEEKGQMKAEERIARNLLIKMNLTAGQAAGIAGVSVEFVEQVRQKMAENK